MVKFTDEQKKFIIKTVYKIQNNNKLTIQKDLKIFFDQQFNEVTATFEQIYRVFKNRPKVKVTNFTPLLEFNIQTKIQLVTQLRM